MKIKLLVLLVSMFALTSMSIGQTQKFGYLNSQGLLAELPDVKGAEANLDALQKQLEKKGLLMVQSLEAKYKELQRKEQSGEISPKALEEEAKLLKEEEAKLGQFEKESQNQVLTKRQELMQPIIERINTAIKEVATEQGYSYVFDASSGILLYAQEALDVTALVKTKLGL